MNKYLLSFVIMIIAACSPIEEDQPSLVLFESGTDGYACFRIPAIVNTGKTLLAFAEGRKKGCSDTGDIDLVLKRSNDGGKTWGPLQVVWDAGDDVAGNPAPVYDKKTKTVFLLSTWNLGSDHESRIIDGTSKDTRRVFVLKSDDQGASWSGAKEISNDTKLDNWTWYATGPVHGIQKQKEPHKGRLIIPCDHIEADTKHYYSHAIFSDDHGETWVLGGTTPQHQVNECTVVELDDGRLMLNMRNYDRSKRARKISISEDGGESWSDIKADLALPEPICQAAILKSSAKIDGKTPILFLNPASPSGREKLTLKISYDEAKTWSDSLLIHSGPAAYSDLCNLKKDKTGCLYEAGENSPYEGIQYKSIKIPWK
ncbi:MAG: exo-alpha-sialidase [Bacteroidetes bacterium]|jgi:sialidase-1|nr:exo-alpha-sialidase [Bacteroidota bacterium]MBT4399833.1 exo-alpha-sialidase [Bacteroidota bacterium]MBT4410905.1 exo-alpha-sialidase [Bacteroidota bacterium]MBT5426695.1 exo-alpha-sialidase [Bacteroidota bacterium]MBT7095328.1 exo-alpha-sialidase [Bacteroidota bacterium]